MTWTGNVCDFRWVGMEWPIVTNMRFQVYVSLFHFVVREGRRMLPLPPKGLRGLLGPNPVHTMGIGQGTPWMSCQLIAGPLLMAVAATQSAHQEQLWGSVSCSRTSTCSSVSPRGAGIRLATFWSPVHQLYPLSPFQVYLINKSCIQLFHSILLNKGVDNQFKACATPTFSEHHSFVCWEAGGQGLAAQIFFVFPQVFPLQRSVAPQPPEFSTIACDSFMGALDTGHLLRSDKTITPVTNLFINHIPDHVLKHWELCSASN